MNIEFRKTTLSWLAALLLPVLLLMASQAQAVSTPSEERPVSSPRQLLPGDRVLVQVYAPLLDPETGRGRKARDVYHEALGGPAAPVRFVFAVASVDAGKMCSSEGRCVQLDKVESLHVLRLCEEGEQRKWCVLRLLVNGLVNVAAAAPVGLNRLSWADFHFAPREPQRWNLTAADPWALTAAEGVADGVALAALGSGPVVDIGGGVEGLGDLGGGLLGAVGRALGGIGRGAGGALSGLNLSGILSGLGSGLGGIGSISLGGLGGGGGGSATPLMLLVLLGLLGLRRQRVKGC